ncbi:hypothetical protein ACF082_22015 [Streptomyces lydicus]|uniref:hypothetical protein n=1 Tax=Streptomyces lydicus TaxID=47763 RepID=UPI00332840A0
MIEQALTPADEQRDDGQVQFVDQPGAQVPKPAESRPACVLACAGSGERSIR